MISVLIPVYNYNVHDLVFEVFEQCISCKIEFEIIVLDDASKLKFESEVQKISSLNNCTYRKLEKNIGRSAIRNLLAKTAQFENLLFLDADTIPLKTDFIRNYLSQINNQEKVVYGGIQYLNARPPKNKILRWIYGKKREALTVEQRNKNPYLRFLTLNFLIKKSVFDIIKFNEFIPNLRHEDTLFSYDLMKQGIEILHFENPVIHLGLDDFEITIIKEKQSLGALKNLIDKGLLAKDYVSISNLYFKIKNLRLLFIFKLFLVIFEKLIIKNLSSENPSLFLFDLYRISYLCTLK